MSVPDHPMRRFARENPDAMRHHMEQVRAHRKPQTKKEPMADKFIQKAIKRPGALTAKAKAAGMSVSEYAAKNAHASGVTGDEARFYNNVLAKVNRK